MSPDGTLTLTPVPETPLVLCTAGFLTTLAKVERDVAAHKITDAASNQAAADMLVRLTEAGKKLEDARRTLKAPFEQKSKEIENAAKGPMDRIEAAKRLIKTKATDYALAERQRAEKAEAERRAEIARLEKLAKEEAAKAPKLPVIEDDDIVLPPPKSEAQKALEAAKAAPAIVHEAPKGVIYKARLVVASIDVTKLPEKYVTRIANETAIRQAHCVGWKDGQPIPELAGVSFRVDRQMVSSGKVEF